MEKSAEVGGDQLAAKLHLEHYLPRSFLDTGPEALSSPDFSMLTGDLPSRVEVTLLIESSGSVGYVIHPDSVHLPVGSQLLAAFERVRFRPGMIAGVAVPSRIRIELVLSEVMEPVLIGQGAAAGESIP